MARLSSGLGDFHFKDDDSKSADKATSLEDIFEEVPVSLDVFVEDSYFFGGMPLSPIQYDFVQHMERIYLPSTYALMDKADNEWEYWRRPSTLTGDKIRLTNFLTAQWGKGGGKDMTVRVGYLRIAYLLLCLKNPQAYFGKPQNDPIHMLNLAANADQANNVFFNPLIGVVSRGWFKDKADPKKSQIDFDKHIFGKSGHSSAERQEGMNLILSVIDEVDAFPSASAPDALNSNRSEASTVEYMIDMVRSSGKSRFPPNFKNVRISYPRYLGSVIQQLTDEGREDIRRSAAEGVPSRHYVSGPWTTWDVNPTRTKEDFMDEYEGPNADPEHAMAKYECKPSRAINTYFTNIGQFRDGLEGEQPISITYEYEKRYSPIMESVVETWTPKFHFEPWFTPSEGAIYGIHVDLAVTGDRAGIAMSHVKDYVDDEYTQFDEDKGESTRRVSKPIVRNDFTIAFEATKDVPAGTPARDIQPQWARQLIFELVKRGFSIGLVSYDGFQSVDSLQILENNGFETDKKSTDRAGNEFWKTLKDVVSDHRLSLPKNELLLNEIESLGQIKNKIDHPPGGSKDMADAFAISVANAIELGGRETDSIAYPQDDMVFNVLNFQMPAGMQQLKLPQAGAASWW